MDQGIKMLPPIAALLEDVVQAHQAQVLRDARAGELQRIGQGIYITLPGTQFLDDSDPVRMGNNTKNRGEFLGDQLTLWHLNPPRHPVDSAHLMNLNVTIFKDAQMRRAALNHEQS